jgi:hypothetical protein
MLDPYILNPVLNSMSFFKCRVDFINKTKSYSHCQIFDFLWRVPMVTYLFSVFAVACSPVMEVALGP